MIKLKSLLEQLTQRDYDSEIRKLESEWERLDNMGGREIEQSQISKQIEQLGKLKLKWEKMYKIST